MNIRRFVSSLLIANLLYAPIAHTKESSLYETIKQEYLPGLALAQPDKTKTEDVSEEKLKQDLQLRHLPSTERKLLAFDLLAEQDATQDKGFIQRHSWEDLELFKSSNLLRTIKHTRTSFGEAVLGTLLINGASVDDVQKNQALVKELVENEKLFNQIDTALTDFASAESLFLSYYLPVDPAKKNYFKDFYFNGLISSRLFSNENVGALNFFTHLEGVRHGSCFALGTDLVVSVKSACAMGLIGFAMDRIGRAHQVQALFGGNDSAVKTLLKSELLSPLPLTSLYLLYKAVRGEQTDVPNIYNYWLQNGGHIPAWLAFLFGTMISYGWYETSKNGYRDLNRQMDATHYLQSHMIAWSTAVDSLQKVGALAQHHSCLLAAIPNLHILQELPEKGTALGKSLALLNTKTFRGKPSYLSNQGRVLVTHKLITEHCKLLRTAFETLGTVDAFMSAAKTYKHHLSTPVKYCFVQFRHNAAQPYLRLVNFWNPVLDTATAIPNTIELGAPGKHRNMILTGLNSAGKSTIIKGMVTSVLLAQIFGIAPAEEAEMTPFKIINTHIVIKDDIEHHKSLFQVEVRQAKNILDRVRSLQTNEFALVVIDEMFRSTGPRHAEKHSYNYAKRLTAYPNVITLEATHYPKLIELEQETKGLFKNFKIEILKDANGKLQRPYKIEAGFTTSEITEALFEEEGLVF